MRRRELREEGIQRCCSSSGRKERERFLQSAILVPLVERAERAHLADLHDGETAIFKLVKGEEAAVRLNRPRKVDGLREGSGNSAFRLLLRCL